MSKIISIGTAVPAYSAEQSTILDFMQADHKADETIFSIGFGPGLSIETALLSYAC